MMKYEREAALHQPERNLLIRTRLQLAVELVSEPGIRVVCRKPADARFSSAIAFGVAWAAERYALAGSRAGIQVTVFFVECEHLGPRVAVLGMLAAQCACAALGLPDEDAPHLEADRYVVFPL